MQKNILELRSQLDRERQYRKVLEDKNRVLEAKFYPEKIKELTRQVRGGRVTVSQYDCAIIHHRR